MPFVQLNGKVQTIPCFYDSIDKLSPLLLGLGVTMAQLVKQGPREEDRYCSQVRERETQGAECRLA